MAVKKFRPYTPSRRFMTVADFSELTKKRPEKSLTAPMKKTGGATTKAASPAVSSPVGTSSFTASSTSVGGIKLAFLHG